ncbi:MAG: GreA/GreB family elongation factor [Kofleriaceae bacterium]
MLDWELHRAEIVEQRSVSPDVVTMNSEVVYEDCATGARLTVRLVYPKDADAGRGWISVLAPIGSALLGLKVGQQIDWQLPAGQKRLVVVEIRSRISPPQPHRTQDTISRRTSCRADLDGAGDVCPCRR